MVNPLTVFCLPCRRVVWVMVHRSWGTWQWLAKKERERERDYHFSRMNKLLYLKVLITDEFYN